MKIAQLFNWCKAYLINFMRTVGINETLVPASELQEAMNCIEKFEGALGRKTLQNENLKKFIDLAKERKWIKRSSLLPAEEQ